MQHALGRALPQRLAVPDLHQLAGERQLVAGEADRRGERVAQLQHGVRQVRRLALHRRDLVAQPPELGLGVGQLAAQLEHALGGLLRAHGVGFEFGPGAVEQMDHRRRRVGRGPAERAAGFVGAAAPDDARGALLVGGAALLLQVGDQRAAEAGAAAVHGGQPDPLGVGLALDLDQFAAAGVDAQREFGDRLAEQPFAGLLAPRLDGLAHRVQAQGGRVLGAEALVFLARRLQGGDLALGLDHRLVRRVELAELGHQLGRRWRRSRACRA